MPQVLQPLRADALLPVLDIVEGVLAGDGVDEDDSLGTAEVSWGDGALKPLHSRSVVQCDLQRY